MPTELPDHTTRDRRDRHTSTLRALELGRQRRILRESIFDLGVELADLADEIQSRTERVVQVQQLLRASRGELAALNATAA